MVETVVTAQQIDREQVLEELKNVVDADELEIASSFDKDAGAFSITLKVPVGEKNFDPINRIIAMSVHGAL